MINPDELKAFMQKHNFHAMVLVVLSPDGSFTYVRCPDQLIGMMRVELTEACNRDKAFKTLLTNSIMQAK